MKNFCLAVQRLILGLLILGFSSVSSMVYAAGCVPITSVPMTITTPGNYCLSEDLLYTGFYAAIEVQSDDVTIDFESHEIRGSSVQSMTGVSAGAVNNTVVRNGKITNARSAVVVGRNALVENMIINDVVAGVSVGGEYSVIRNNIITDVVPKYEAGAAGILIISGCGHLVENNKIRNYRKFQGGLSTGTYGDGIRIYGCQSVIKNNFIEGKNVAGAGESVGIYDDQGADNLIIGNRFSGRGNKNLKCGSTTKYKDNISTSYFGGNYDCTAGDLGGNL